MAPSASGARSGKAAGRPRIAFLAAALSDDYEWPIWRGVKETVEARGGTVVWFAGAGLDAPHPDGRARSRVFDFVHPTSIDAVLSLSSVIGHHVGASSTEQWLLERGLLACSIGPAEHVPSVVVDDSTGVTQVMRHLIEQHDHKRIAFVTGTPSSTEAQRRLSAYIQVLTDHGLTFDPRLTLTGDFTAESGVRAIHELFDTRKVPSGSLDAVVCSNDYMAFGVIEELARRRIVVPDKVAVVGFDDIAPARLHNPSLTTVRQPLEELGRKGAERLFYLLDGGVADGALTLPTELVLRRSCGCTPTEIPAPLEEPAWRGEPASSRTPLSGFTLEAALDDELEGSHGAFAQALEPYVRRLAAGNPQKLARGRAFAHDLGARLRLAREDLVHQRLSRLSRVLHQRMFGPQTLLSAALADSLPDFGMQECVVAELGERAPGHDADTLTLAFGFDAKNREPPMTTFDARLLVPPSFEHLRARSCLLLPLTFDGEMLGVVVAPGSERDGAFYEALGEIFSSILKVLELRRNADRSGG